MKDLLVLAIHLITTIAKLMGPGGARAIVAESLFMKQQLLVVNRSRQRASNLSALDRIPIRFLVTIAESAPYPEVRSDYQAINTAALPRSAGKV
jgi:shikimate 5-dehydrogenase